MRSFVVSTGTVSRSVRVRIAESHINADTMPSTRRREEVRRIALSTASVERLTDDFDCGVQTPSEPAFVPEERDHPDDRRDHEADNDPESGVGPLAGEADVHPEDARDQRQREDDHAEHRQDPQDVVLPVRDDRLVRVLERLHDLLVVVEQVPDALGGVDKVVEVELEVLREETLDVSLEQAEGRPLRLDDLAVGDDLLLHPGDVVDDLLGAQVLDVVLDRVELVGDLVENREAVVEEVVQHLVQQAAGPLAEELLAELLVLLAAAEEPRHRQQLDVRHRHEVVGAEEEVELACVQPLDGLVVGREVQDAEQVALVGVVVDLGPLALGQNVLDVEWMPAEARPQLVDGLGLERLEVDPGQPVGAELSDAWFRARNDRLCEPARPRPPDAGQAWHRYGGDRRSLAPCSAWYPGRL